MKKITLHTFITSTSGVTVSLYAEEVHVTSSDKNISATPEAVRGTEWYNNTRERWISR